MSTQAADYGTDAATPDDIIINVTKGSKGSNNIDDQQKEGSASDADADAECKPICEELSQLKWFAMIPILFLSFGGYYIYDFPGSIGTGPTGTIQAHFAAKSLTYTQEMNQGLYSIYSWPNTVAATFGGLLVDNLIGLRKSVVIFITLVAIGAVIFWVGVQTTSFPVMMAGRFVFGLGNESLSVAQQAFIARYFRGKWGLAMAYGITISFSRVGSSLNFLLSPRIGSDIGIDFACLVGVFMCCLSVVSTVLLVLLDLHSENKGKVAKQIIKRESGGASFSKKDLEPLNQSFAMVCVICVTVYISVFTFVGVGKNFFEVRYGISGTEAATYISFFQFACSGFSPFSGAVVDRTGRAVLWMIFAGAGFGLTHLLFLLFSPEPIAMTMWMGVVYSFLAGSLWPAVPLLLPPTSIGLAYGLMNSLQNTGLAIAPLVAGAMLDSHTPDKIFRTPACEIYKNSKFNTSLLYNFSGGSLVNCQNNTDAPLPSLEGFKQTELLFLCVAAAGVLAGFNLLRIDLAGDRILISNRDDRKAILKQKLATWALEEEERKREAAIANPEKASLIQSPDSANASSSRLSMATCEDKREDPRDDSPHTKDGLLTG